MQKTDYLYVGMDIHKEPHTAVLMNYMEEPIGEIQIENNLKGFERLYAYVEKWKQQYTPMYGLEDVSHYGRNLAYVFRKTGVKYESMRNILVNIQRY